MYTQPMAVIHVKYYGNVVERERGESGGED